MNAQLRGLVQSSPMKSVRIEGKQTDVRSLVPKGFMDTLYLNWSKFIIDEYLWEKQADL